MRKLTGIVVLAVTAVFVPVRVSGANLLKTEWAGRELHLVDRDVGASNSNLYWRVPNAVLKDVRGKALYFGGRVKQVDASGISAVSLYIAAHSKDGKARRESVSATGVRGATPWLALRAKVQVPADAESVRLAIRCAHGFWQTGEATFKDLILTTDPAELPPDGHHRLRRRHALRSRRLLLRGRAFRFACFFGAAFRLCHEAVSFQNMRCRMTDRTPTTQQ